MSIKLIFLLLVGVIVLAGALPAENDEPEDQLAESETDLQDPEETAADPSKYRPRRKKVYCTKHIKKRRCKRRCRYDKVRAKYGKGYKKVKRCFKLCCDYIYRKRYLCGYCYRTCGLYGGYRRCRYRCRAY